MMRSFTDPIEIRLATELDCVHALAFSPDGKQLAIAGGSPAESGSVELWSWPERKLLRKLQGHEDVIYDACWLPDGRHLATAGGDRTVRIWDSAEPKNVRVLKGHSGPVLALAVSPDGKHLCSGSQDQTIRVWDVDKGQLLRSFDNHFGPVHALAFRPAQEMGRPPYLASASEDGTVRVWQPTIGRMVRIIKHPCPVYGVAWSTDGETLITAGKDGTLRTLADGTNTFLKQQQLTAERLTYMIRAGDRCLVGTSRGDVLGK
ncbi:MAG: WD40 repeat domain-containing protein [Planctomycetia bacterium]|nr:WD40 repeat domain-containing protein [Planctomycetia bacterium]